MGGQARGLGQFPGAGLEAVGLRGQGAHRAEIDNVARQFVGQGMLDEGTDAHLLATTGGPQFPYPGNLGAKAHAAGTVDTARHVGGDEGTQILVHHHPLALDIARDVPAIAHGDVLQFALPTLITDGAVQGMVDEQELHGPLLGLKGLGGAGHDLEPGADRGGTGRHRLGKGSAVLLHLHQAHTAVGGDGQLLVVAEARDRDPLPVSDRDNHLSRGRLAGATVDLNGDLVRHCAVSVADRPIRRPQPGCGRARCSAGIRGGSA